eukprot:2719416-Rhodomonas_salina.10
MIGVGFYRGAGAGVWAVPPPALPLAASSESAAITSPDTHTNKVGHLIVYRFSNGRQTDRLGPQGAVCPYRALRRSSASESIARREVSGPEIFVDSNPEGSSERQPLS